MKIVHLVDHYHPWLGYQHRYLAEEHAKRGHDVTVVTSNRSLYPPSGDQSSNSSMDRQAPRMAPRSPRVMRLKTRFVLPTMRQHPWLQHLAKVLRDLDPDVVNCHELLTITAARTASMRASSRFALVVDNHTAAFNLLHPGESRSRHVVKKATYKLLGRTVGRGIAESADAIVAIGEPEQEFVHWMLGFQENLNVPIIRLGADEDLFRFDTKDRSRIRKAKNWDTQDIVLGHAGRIRPGKQVEDLITAVELMDRQQIGAKIYVHIVGRINDNQKLQFENLAQSLGLRDQLRIEGEVPHAQLSATLSAWDVAVWPGDISATLFEAMSVGLPIVAARTSYTESLVHNQGAGVLFERSNVSDLAAAISMLVKDHKIRLRSGRRARELVVSQLNWGVVSEQFLDLYERVMVPSR